MSKLSIADEIRALECKAAEIKERHKSAYEKEVASVEEKLGELYKQRQSASAQPLLVPVFDPSLWGQVIVEEAIIREAMTKSMQEWARALEEESVSKAFLKKS